MKNENKPSCCAASREPSAKTDTDVMVEKKSSAAFTDNMIKLTGGTFLMGTNDEEGFPDDGEGPIREITLDPFYIDPTTVTNFQFAEFINATGYKTDAERFGWSFVFYGLLAEEDQKADYKVAAPTPWWCAVPGAQWNHPEGKDSRINERMSHPVVHVSWDDAQAYCHWTGKRLPTEAEWEYAARGGLAQKKFPWGDELTPGGEYRCNIWQGNFPDYNSLEDGYLGTAPAKSFKPNDFGLYNMSGNVWEWCNDWFSRDFHKSGPRKNPTGPNGGEAKVIRGGSFLCQRSYCNRYRVAARSSNTKDSSTSNMGFRCALNSIDN
ncbi:MAG TPA: formylglycine-generating enzyme family protein [Hanamia sp.]|nr:formylglycine-generating enzyme family protein [Hanamia sp.]